VCVDAMLAARLITPGDLAASAATRPGWTGLFVARLDMAYPEYKLGIEYEGDHRGAALMSASG
jgi:hypothetical protein